MRFGARPYFGMKSCVVPELGADGRVTLGDAPARIIDPAAEAMSVG